MDEDREEQAIEEPTFDVRMGLRKALPFFPARRSGLVSDDSLDLIAETVVEHLKRCRWRLHRHPPVKPHGVSPREGDDSFEPTSGRITGTPNLSLGLADGGERDWRLGWRHTPTAPAGPSFEVKLDATHREAANDSAADHDPAERSRVGERPPRRAGDRLPAPRGRPDPGPGSDMPRARRRARCRC